MKKWILITCLLVLFIFTGSKTNENLKELHSEFTQTTQKIYSYDEFLDSLNSKEKNWSGLTSAQYVEDLQYLYQQLKENYPYFGVAKRKYGMDLDDQYIIAHKKLESCNNDVDFRLILKSDFITHFVGHLDVWGTRYIDQLNQLKSFSEQDVESRKKFVPYIKALENPVSKNNYEKMKKFYDKQEQAYSAYLKSMGEATKESQDKQITESAPITNIKTKIIEKDRVAYISIQSFNTSQYDSDKKTLFAFYDKVANYDNLIIDISENGGGDMAYFTDLVVAPNINKTISTPAYMFVKGGENNFRFLQLDEVIKSGEWKPISNFHGLPRMNKDDLRDLDYFSSASYTVKPLYNKKKFNGKIWMLVSGNVYSSSEFAAMFSKSTGFATLVGSNTGGDGIGTDPAYIVLPNSGIVVQYSMIYGTTADGANSEEFGTKPNFESPKGESPLDTCLKLIHKNN